MALAKPAGAVWPDTVTLSADDLAAGPARIRQTVATAAARSQRLRLPGSISLGSDVRADLAVLRLLTEATAQLVPLDWELAAAPPWPVRMMAHLAPPRAGSGAFAASWRKAFRFGLCTYRLGPGFATIRDQRPDGQRLRVQIAGPWADSLDRLASDSSGPYGEDDAELLDQLAAIGLAMRFGTAHHIVPFRLRRWPVPFTSV